MLKLRFDGYITTRQLDCEQSLFSFRFSESNARAWERRSRETRETRAPCAISHARGHLRVSCFGRWTTEKRETARSLHVNRPYLRMRMQNVEEKKRIRTGETVQADSALILLSSYLSAGV